MEQIIEYVKYLGVKVFSNKYYSIHVMLFEQGMARVGMRYKKRKNERQLWRWGSNHLCFDECRRESVYDTWDCLHFLQMDKTARRWFRKVLHPCFEKFLMPKASSILKLRKKLRLKSGNSKRYIGCLVWKKR